VVATQLGALEVAHHWASFTGRARVSPSNEERSFTAIIEQADPFMAGTPPTITIMLEGREPVTGVLSAKPTLVPVR
jgi:hypothetical protein